MTIAKSLRLFLALSSLFFLTTVIYAKEINLYEEPKTNAKIVGKADLDVGIIPIFNQKNTSWMKVADPRNGNVGWIESKEMTGNTVVVQQQFFKDNKGAHTFQIIKYGDNQATLTEQQTREYYQKMQAEQQALQKNMQKNIQQMMENFNKLMQLEWGSPIWHENFPWIKPAETNAPIKTLPLSKPTQAPAKVEKK